MDALASGAGPVGLALVIAACALGAVACGLAARWYVERCRRENRARELKRAVGMDGGEASHAFAVEGIAASVLACLWKEQRRADIRGQGREVRLGGKTGAELRSAFVRELVQRRRERFGVQLRQAGLAEVGEVAYLRTTLRFAAFGVAAGGLLGLGVGIGAACFLGVAGGAAGAAAPRWAINRERHARAEALSQELPEMLSVCALGLRSGLTFDRSFRLYPGYFDTTFARDCKAAMERMEVGLASREDALLDLAAAYDSPLLERTLRGTIQALHRGTALADDLEATAEESRKQYRARKEEAVAKAPIRMMVPIGVLILPAMLLLVLGPVLLSLVQGF